VTVAGVLDLFRPPQPETPEAPPPLTAATFPRRRALTASVKQVTPETGAALMKAGRSRTWQDAAFTYQRALPEVGYVVRFLSHNCAHIRLTVGDRPRGADEVRELDDDYGWVEQEDGTVLRDPDALPEDLVWAAQDALATLTGSSPSGGGAAVLAPLVANLELTGEAWLVGEYDPDTNREQWGIYSKSELRFQDGRLPQMDPDGPPGYYRLVTSEDGKTETRDLDPAYTTTHRLWTADTQWSSEPSSPMRSLAGVCERLLLIERATDAALRSRAAGNGFILVPDELSPPPADDDEADEQADEFQQDLTTQITTPLAQDGSAASVVPGVLRGPAQYLDKIRHLTVDRPMDEKLAALEQRLLARLGIGLDVPPEVITGYADVNHWNVWQVDSDTFKHHQEPITIAGCELLTLAYLRARLETAVAVGAANWTQEQIDRLVMWYDPASLITPPDQREAANDAYDRGTISGKAHRRVLGFDEGDAPEDAQQAPDEAVGLTGMSAALLAQVAVIARELVTAGFDPDSVTSALGLEVLSHTGVVPTAGPPALPAGGTGAPPADGPAGEETPPPAEEETPEAEATVAAAGPPVSAYSRRLSRRLTEIDRTLRERLTAAADAALNRALERAGNRLRSRANGNPEARTAAAGVPGERVAATMGRTLVAALGVEEEELLTEAFERFRGQYTDWTLTAAEEAIDTAAKLSGLNRTDPSVMRMIAGLRDSYADAVELSWPGLQSNLLTVAEGALYDPDPTLPAQGEVPSTAVPPGVLREALAVAGGLPADATGQPPLSGLSSGQLLTGFLRDNGCQASEYEWTYGISARPFKPHQDLDGVAFTDWDDPALRAPTEASWIGASLAPGDHKGCHCDYGIIWTDGGRARAEQEAIGRAAYREQNEGAEPPGWDATLDPRVSTPDRVAVPVLRPSAATSARRQAQEEAAEAAARAAEAARIAEQAAAAKAAAATRAEAEAARQAAERAAEAATRRAALAEVAEQEDMARARAAAQAASTHPGARPVAVTRTVTGTKTHMAEVEPDGKLSFYSLCNVETPRNVRLNELDDALTPTCKRCQASAAKRAREAPPEAPAEQAKEWTKVGGRAPTDELMDEVRVALEIYEDEGWDPGLRVDLDEYRIYVSDPDLARRTLEERASIVEDELGYLKRQSRLDASEREQRNTYQRKLTALQSLINRIPL
jgi:hypothetical protein